MAIALGKHTSPVPTTKLQSVTIARIICIGDSKTLQFGCGVGCGSVTGARRQSAVISNSAQHSSHVQASSIESGYGCILCGICNMKKNLRILEK